MKSFTSVVVIGRCATALARPDLQARYDAQTVHLTFHGGPAFYDMEFPADGQAYKTNNDISINIIDALEYNAF
ncbi:Fc.00g035500.m01.CDS01 [Cosmosporella sp. VM-42]